MDSYLKEKLIRTIFQFKNLTATGFGTDSPGIKRDINLTEMVLMKSIADNALNSARNITLRDVRWYLSVSKAAVSQTLASLEKKGYIHREPDKVERRRLIVTLTPEGREVLATHEKLFDARFDKIMNALGEYEVKQLIRIVGRLMDIVDTLEPGSEQVK